MWSFQDQYTQFQNLAQNTDASILTIGKANINMGQKILETEIGAYAAEDSRSITTVNTTNIYESPENMVRMKQLYVTAAGGSFRYDAEEIFDEEVWQVFMRNTTIKSDVLQKVFNRGKTFEVFPTFSTAGLTMTLIYERLSKDLSADDYTSGTITTLGALGTAITGASTVWTAAMVGRYIQFSGNNDTEWYEIASRASNTSITLKKAYQGAAIAAGTVTYRIGEIPRTPAGTHIIPVYFALWQHYMGVRRDKDMANYYKGLYEQYMSWAKTEFKKRYSSGYIPNYRNIKHQGVKNPNWYPRLLS